MKKFLYCIVATLLLQGCTAAYQQKFTDADLYQSSPGLKTVDEQKQQAFTDYQGAFLGKEVVYNSKQQQLLAQPVSFHSQSPISLNTILNSLASQAKISYRIDTSLPGTRPGKTENGASGGLIKSHKVSFQGSMEDFFNYLSSLYDVTIHLNDNGVLQASVWHTYAIKLDFFGEDNDYDASLDLSGNQSTSSGGVKGKSEVKFTSSFWDDVDKMAQKYVSSGIYNIFKDQGIITFTARPSEYQLLSKLFKDFRDTNNKQFIITYKVFILDKGKSNSFNADLGALLNFNKGTTLALNAVRMAGTGSNGGTAGGTGGTTGGGTGGTGTGGTGGGTGGTGGGSSGSGSGTGNTSLGTGLGFGFKNSGRLGVDAMLDALYKLTGSKLLQSGTMVTRNNVPAPLNLTSSQNYVSGITQSLNNNFVSSQVQTDTLVTGTSVIITPRVLSDGRIEVTSAFTKKDSGGIDSFSTSSSGGGSDIVQLPRVQTTEMFNTVDVTPGTLIVVGKYDTSTTSDNRDLHILGTNLAGSDNTHTVVMVIGIDYYNKPFTEN